MARHLVYGAGGDGGGGGHVAVEDPNTLKSVQYATIMDVLSEGPIEGFVSAPKQCVYLDDTPMQDAATGAMNFTVADFDYRYGGLDNNTPITGLTAVEAENSVGLEVTKVSPVIRSFTNQNLDALRVTLATPQLSHTTDNGDMHGTRVDFTIDIQKDGGGWVPIQLDFEWVDRLTSEIAATVFTTGGASSHSAAYGMSVTVAATCSNYADLVFEYKKPGDSTWTRGGGYHVDRSSHEERSEYGDGYVSILTVDDITAVTWETPLLDMVGSWAVRVTQTQPMGGSPITLTLESYRTGNFSTIGRFIGKTTSRYQRAYYIKTSRYFAGNSGAWDIRVSRVTDPASTLNLNNATYFDSYTEVIEQKFTYPAVALAFLKVDAKQFRSVPTRGYLIKGLKVQIPDNYDPISRTYTGVWLGGFKAGLHWTDNPAWILYDILTNNRYGLGDYTAGSVNKWVLYDIAQHCDAMVPSGTYDQAGNPILEPRYSCNCYIQSREEAFTLVNSIASVFRGMLYEVEGSLTAVADMPAEATALFTQANVIEGMFVYSGSSAKSRHTVALVGWNDPKDMYRQKVEYVELKEAVKEHGIIQTTITAFGCTSRGQARRVGKWLLYSEYTETETVSFKTGLNGEAVFPGAIIKTADVGRTGNRIAGRLVSATTTSLVLDSPVEILNTFTYTVSVVEMDGSVATSPVSTGSGTTSTLTLATPLSSAPSPQAMWILESSDLAAETWRVMAVAETEPNIYEVTAIAHNPSKFDYIEKDEPLEDRNTSGISQNPPAAPTNLTAVDSLYLMGAGSIGVKVALSWQSRSSRYLVRYRPNEGNWREEWTEANSIDIMPVQEMLYQFQVVAYDGLGRKSQVASLDYTVIGKTAPPANVTALTAVTVAGGILLNFTGAADLDLASYEVTIGSTTVNIGKSTTYLYTTPTLGANTFTVKSVDTSGNRSSGTAVTLTTTAPSVPSYFHADIRGGSAAFKVTLPTVSSSQFPLAGYRIRYGTTWADGVEVEGGVLNPSATAINFGGSRTYWAAAVDTLGNVGPAASSAITVSAPPAPTVSHVFANDQSVLTWTAVEGSVPTDMYVVRYGSTWETGTHVYTGKATSFQHKATWSGALTFWVAAVDLAGNYGAAGSVTATVSLSAPTVTHAFSGANSVLSWSAPASTLPIIEYEVWSGGTKVSSVTATTFSQVCTWPSNKSFTVTVVDSAGNRAQSADVAANVSAPGAPGTGTWEIKGETLVLSWQPNKESLPIVGYNLSDGVGMAVSGIADSTYTLRVNFSGNRTYSIQAIDTVGNVSATLNITSGIAMPAAVSMTGSYVGTSYVMKWSAPSIGATQLPIAKYEVRVGGTLVGATHVGFTDATTLSVPVSWTSGRTFWLTAIDTGGNVGLASQLSASFSAPSTVTVSSSVAQTDAILTWSDSVGSLPIDHYEVRHGAVYATGEILDKAYKTTFTTPVVWSGSRVFWITPVDANGNTGTPSSTTVAVDTPAVITSFDYTVIQAKAALSWSVPVSTLPIKEYVIKRGITGFDWASGEEVTRIAALDFRAPIDWLGTRAFRVAAVNSNNTEGTPSAELAVVVNAPSAPAISSAIEAENLVLTWTEPASTLPIEEYEVWHTAQTPETSLGRVKGSTMRLKAAWLGDRAFIVRAYDVNGNEGAAGQVTAHISAPSLSSLTTQVVDNNVLLYWAGVPGSLPIVTYEIRKGSSWDAATSLGTKAGGFTTVFETVSGTYTYWVAAIDSAGNVGAPLSRSSSVAQPPDYILKANYTSTFTDQAGVTAGFSNAFYSAGSVTLPVNTTETFAEHFTSRGWSGPQDQINAGYPVFAQPGALTGYYEEVIDYGTVLSASKINVTVGGSVISGSPSITVNISTKLNLGDAWVDYTNAQEVFVTNIRYVKVQVVVSGTATALYRLENLNTRLDAKLINDAGMASAVASDSGGTWVSFNIPFVDVSSITVTPQGTTPLIAIYDFVDTPNPTGFRVLLFNQAGSRVSGTVSWGVKGY